MFTILIKGKENEKKPNNNEGFDKLHMILLIHVNASAQIRQVKWKRPVEKYACYHTGSRHASRRQRGLQCVFQCLPMFDWAPLTRVFVTPFGCV